MEFLEKIELDDNSLIDLAYKRYLDDLNTNFLYIFKVKSVEKEYIYTEVNQFFADSMPNTFKEINNNNPTNLDKIICYKLLLCSYLSPWWGFEYPKLYNYFIWYIQNNPTQNIDIFIGKIEALFEKDNDLEFNSFIKIVNLKY
jgi:hypothetical protein